MKRMACKRCGHEHDCPKVMSNVERARLAAMKRVTREKVRQKRAATADPVRYDDGDGDHD